MQSSLDVLLAHGANPEAQDLFLSTPLHYACEKGELEAAKILVGLSPSLLYVRSYFSCSLLIYVNYYKRLLNLQYFQKMSSFYIEPLITLLTEVPRQDRLSYHRLFISRLEPDSFCIFFMVRLF